MLEGDDEDCDSCLFGEGGKYFSIYLVKWREKTDIGIKITIILFSHFQITMDRF